MNEERYLRNIVNKLSDKNLKECARELLGSFDASSMFIALDKCKEFKDYLEKKKFFYKPEFELNFLNNFKILKEKIISEFIEYVYKTPPEKR